MLPRYQQIIDNVRKMASKDASNDEMLAYLAYEGLSGEQFASLLEGPTFFGQAKEALKGIPAGAIGLLETAATGASALLPDDMEAAAREKIAGVAGTLRRPFEAAPGYEETIPRKLSEAVGSTLPFLAAGPLGVAGRVGAVGLGTAAGAGEARQRAEMEGATGEQRAQATALGIIPGALEVFPPFRILSRIPEGEVLTGIQIAKRALTAGGEEAAQEALSGWAQNLIAKGIYKPEQELIEGLGEQAAYGGAAGAMIQGVIDLALGRRPRGAPREPAAPTAAAPVTGPQGALFTPEEAPTALTPDESAFAQREESLRAEGRQQELLNRLDSLRNEFDTLQRENERLSTQADQAATEQERQAIQAQAARIAPALSELDKQIRGIRRQLGAAEAARPTTPEGQAELDFETPLMRRSRTGEGVPLGATPVAEPGLSPEQERFFQAQRLQDIETRINEGQPVTPLEQRLLQEEKRVAAQKLAAQPTPDLAVVEGMETRVPPFRLQPADVVQPTIPVREAPEVETRPVTEADFKEMGISATNKKLRERILGKDLADPEQRREVRAALEEFGGDPKRSPALARRVEDFLSRPFFQEQLGFQFAPEGEQDVGRTTAEADTGAIEPSVPVPQQRRPRAAARPAAPEPEGVVGAREDLGLPARRETTQPSSLAEKQLGDYFVEGGSIPAALRLLGYDLYAGVKPRKAKAAFNSLTREQKDTVNQARNEFSRQEESSKEFLKKDRERQISEREGRAIKYRVTEAGARGNPRDVVDKLVKRITAKWANAPEIRVVQSLTELPDYMQEQIRRDGVNPKGAFDPVSEAVFVVADNASGSADIFMTIAHEAIGHFGLRSVLGKQYPSMMNNLYNGNFEVRRLADRKIRDGLDRATAVEEVLAEVVEGQVAPTTLLSRAVDRIKNAIRALARRLGIGTLTDPQVTELLDAARGYVIEGRGTRAEGEAGAPAAVFSAEEMKIIEGDAAWSPKRINQQLSTWAYLNDPNDTKAYVGFVNPNDFLQATSTAKFREEVLEKEKRPLEVKKIAGEIQPIFLQLQIDKLNQDDVAKIIGHEGRHRMMALRDAGINRVPVVLLNGYAGQRIRDAKPMPGMVLLQEDIGERSFVVRDLTPLSYAYKDQIKQKFGQPSAQVVFRRGEAAPLTPEGERARALNERMKGISQPRADSKETLLKRFTNKFPFKSSIPIEARIRRNLVDKEAPVSDRLKTQYNNAVTDALSGTVRPDLLLAQVQDAPNIADRVVEIGGIEIAENGFINTFEKTDANGNPVNMDRVLEIITIDLGKKLGSPDEALRLAHNAMIAFRAANLNKFNAEKEKQAAAAEAKGNKKAAQLLRDQKIAVRLAQSDIDAGLEAMREFPEIKQALDVFTELKNGLVDFLVKSGRINEETGRNWKENLGYVPWTRVEEEVNLLENIPKTPGKRGIVNLSKLPQLDKEGSSKEIANIFDNMVGTVFWMTRTGINNYAAQETLKGLPDTEVLDTPDKLASAQKDREKEGRIVYSFKDGEREAYLLSDPYYASTFSTIAPVKFGITGSIFASTAKFVRSTITHMPAFALSQLIQDGTYRAMTLSGVRNPFSLPPKVFKNFYLALTKPGEGVLGEMARLGITGAYDGMPDNAARKVRERLGLEHRNAFKKAWDSLENFSLAADLAARAAIFEQTMAETGDQALAYYRAKEYINFKRQGTNPTIGILRQVIPFMNAYMQGMDVLYRTMTGKGVSTADRQAALKLFYMTGAKLAALNLLYTMLVSGDDEYEGLDDFVRNRNYIIPGTGVRIPVAPEVGFLFKVLPEQLYRAVMTEGTMRPQDATAVMDRLRNALVDSYGGVGYLPAFIKPAIEVATNYSFFLESPIVGAGMQQRETALQYTESTSELSKMLGSIANISPAKLDYFIRAYSGMAGAMFLSLSDSLASDKLDKPIYKIPQISTFMYDPTGRGFKSDFYQLREEVSKVAGTVDLFKREGRVEELVDYLGEDKMRVFALKGIVNKVERKLGEFRRYRKIIASDSQLTGAEKRELTDRIIEMETQLVRAYNIPELRKMAGL
jgi:hypothetical protein